MNFTYSTTLVLDALGRGHRYGFEILDVTGLASGTVYPILRRLEREGFVSASWEDAGIAQSEGRPSRRYYVLDITGHELLKAALVRYPLTRSMPSRVRNLDPAWSP